MVPTTRWLDLRRRSDGRMRNTVNTSNLRRYTVASRVSYRLLRRKGTWLKMSPPRQLLDD